MGSDAMSDFKIAGCCTVCNEPCFEVMATWAEHERYPGEPKRLGPVIGNAVEITFMLMDGAKASLTFCEQCGAELNPAQYTDIWRKVIRSWAREMDVSKQGEPRPDWFNQQFYNGLMSEMGRILWSEKHG